MAGVGAMNVLTIDPGKRSLAWALWMNGTLVAAGIEKHKEHRFEKGIADLVWRIQVKTIEVDSPKGYWLGPLKDLHPVNVVVELPRVRPRERSKRPNDLIDLAAVAGACAALGPLEFVHPETWKGQTPKGISQARSRQALSAAELAVMDGVADHNVWDAVGIGIWFREKEARKRT